MISFAQQPFKFTVLSIAASTVKSPNYWTIIGQMSKEVGEQGAGEQGREAGTKLVTPSQPSALPGRGFSSLREAAPTRRSANVPILRNACRRVLGLLKNC